MIETVTLTNTLANAPDNSLVKTLGKLYGIGLGPGDPELLTLKGYRIYDRCPLLFIRNLLMDAASRDRSSLTISSLINWKSP